MLSDYGIENFCIKIEDKKDILSLSPPFIVHIDDDFAIVKEISINKVLFFINNRKVQTSLPDFLKQWKGIALIAEPNAISAEPDYKLHLKKEFLNCSQHILLFLSLLGLIISGGIINQRSINGGMIILFLVNLLGLCISYLLASRQWEHDSYTHAICTLFRQGNCDTVLDSNVAKMGGMIGLSEIGLGYFLSNLFIQSFIPQYANWVAIINITTLLFSIWSIWFQKFKVKQWCPLCLIVQLILWSIFALNLYLGNIKYVNGDFMGLLMVLCIYTCNIIIVNSLTHLMTKNADAERMQYEMNCIKSNENIVEILLQQQERYNVTKDTSQILFGNLNANILVTILLNPFCAPCAKVHKEVKELLKANSSICIQYIFDSFGRELEDTCKFLIASYLNRSRVKAEILYDSWFETGRFAKDSFIRKNESAMDDGVNVQKEFDNHMQWSTDSGIGSTPTILINGHKLPDIYHISDLRFLKL